MEKQEEQPVRKEFLIQRFGGYQILGENLYKDSLTRVELANHILTSTKVGTTFNPLLH